MVRIRTAEGWEGEVHRVDAERWVKVHGAQIVGEAGAEAPASAPKPRTSKPKAKPVDTPPANDLPLDAEA